MLHTGPSCDSDAIHVDGEVSLARLARFATTTPLLSPGESGDHGRALRVHLRSELRLGRYQRWPE